MQLKLYKLLYKVNKMNSQVLFTTLQLMKNGKVFYTIQIENIDSYEFSFNSETLATLSITTPSLTTDDINMLIMQPYDCYVLMAKKRIIKDGKEDFVHIPAKAYGYMRFVDNGEKMKFTFIETR